MMLRPMNLIETNILSSVLYIPPHHPSTMLEYTKENEIVAYLFFLLNNHRYFVLLYLFLLIVKLYPLLVRIKIMLNFNLYIDFLSLFFPFCFTLLNTLRLLRASLLVTGS